MFTENTLSSKSLPSGIWTALVTPFDQKGLLDLPAFVNLVQWQLTQGVQALVLCGSTGETAAINDVERLQLLDLCLRHAKGKIPVIVGASSNDTHKAQELHKRMGQAGAFATLQTVPWYNKPSQEGLYRHFSCIAESCDTPFILYNVPARTGSNLSVDTILRLAKSYPHIIGIKDANTNSKRLQLLIHRLASFRADMVILSGEDHFTLPLLALGGHGVVSVVSNVAPAEMVKLWQAWRKHDISQAQQVAYRMTMLADLLFQQTNPIGAKAALYLMNRLQLSFRLPLCSPEQQEVQQLKTDLLKRGFSSLFV